MAIELDQKVTVKVQAKEISIHVKCTDEFNANLIDSNGNIIGHIEDENVPRFIPSVDCSEILTLNIDLETGQITNWRKPSAKDIEEAFFKKDND